MISHSLNIQKNKQTLLVDTSTDMIDIKDSPDVATWNKGIQVKSDAAIIVNSGSIT